MRAVSDLDLERFLVDELDATERDRVAAAIAADVELAAYVHIRRADQQAFRIAHPRAPAPTVSLWARLRTSFPTAPALAAVACAVLFVAVGRVDDKVDEEVDEEVDGGAATGIVARGALPVALTVLRGGQVFRHGVGVPLRAGDAVRVEVDCPTGGFATVVGVDSRGVVSVYYDGVPVARGRAPLPGSLVLDDAAGAEEWIVIVDATAPGAKRVAQALRQSATDAGDRLAAAFPRATIGVVRFEKESF
jgi:hypothetical protein